MKRIRFFLRRYEVWFTVHWLCHSFVIMLLIIFLDDSIALHLYHTIKAYGDGQRVVHLVFIILCIFQEFFLFIYLCLRALQVKTTRQKLITDFTQCMWKNLKVSEQSYLLECMREQNFGFRLHLGCIDTNFEFNYGMISYLIGIYGIFRGLNL